MARSAEVTSPCVGAKRLAKSHGASLRIEPLQALRTIWEWGSTSPVATTRSVRGTHGTVVGGAVVGGAVVGGTVVVGGMLVVEGVVVAGGAVVVAAEVSCATACGDTVKPSSNALILSVRIIREAFIS